MLMRGFVLGCLVSSFPAHAQESGWITMSPSVYALPPEEKNSVYLMATWSTLTNDAMVNLFRFNENLCGEAKNGELGLVGPYKVNGTLVKFDGVCMNGRQMDSPASQKGKQFLLDLTSSGKPITIELEYSTVLHFAPTASGFKEIRSKLRAAESAM